MQFVPWILVVFFAVCTLWSWTKARALRRLLGMPVYEVENLPQDVTLIVLHKEERAYAGHLKGSLYLLNVANTRRYYSVFTRLDLPHLFAVRNGEVQERVDYAKV